MPLFTSPLVQFNLLHSKFHLCSVSTRALLLSTYIKFINLFPETKGTIQEVLRSDSQIRNADVELQQRAVEYLKLSSIASTDVLVREESRNVDGEEGWGQRPAAEERPTIFLTEELSAKGQKTENEITGFFKIYNFKTLQGCCVAGLFWTRLKVLCVANKPSLYRIGTSLRGPSFVLETLVGNF